MKSRVPVILTLLVMLLSVSCGKEKGLFILSGTVQDDTDTILVVGLDSRFQGVDTIVCHGGAFEWIYRPDTVTTLIMVLPDGRLYPVFAEKDVESEMIIPKVPDLISVTGGPCNDAYHSFNLASLDDSTRQQTIARIDSFITRDPFSEVTPYLIYERMVLRHHASQDEINKLIKRMSGNMQDAPYLTSLKSEFPGELPSNAYISTLTLWDSTFTKKQFADIGGESNYLLVCVWASWTGEEGLKARKEMESLKEKYKLRHLSIADVSIDVNRQSWKKAIVKDTLSWDSYIDIDGWESRLIRSSATIDIPCYILFSSARKVYHRTTSVQEMDAQLDKTLPQHDRSSNNWQSGSRRR